MAWFTYKCDKCGVTRKVSLDERLPEVACSTGLESGTCGGPMKPVLKPGNVKIVERLDNGAMARRVERLHNIEEILAERSDKHSVKQDDEDEDA